MSIITYHLAKWGRSSDPSRREWATTASVRSIVVQLVEVPRNQPKAVVAGLVAAGLVDAGPVDAAFAFVSELAVAGFVAEVEKLVAEDVVAVAAAVVVVAAVVAAASELGFAVFEQLIADAVPAKPAATSAVAEVAATVAYSNHPRRKLPDLDRMVVTCLK
jgi:uncharacterized membrane protein